MKTTDIAAYVPGFNSNDGGVGGFFSKAIGAIEVAGVRHVQAKRLDDARSALLQLARHRFKIIYRKKAALRGKLRYLIVALLYIRARKVRMCRGNGGYDFIPAFALVLGYYVVCDLVHCVNGARGNVKHDIVTAKFVLMYHKTSPNEKYKGLSHVSATAPWIFICLPWRSYSRTSGWQLVLQADWQEVWHSPQPPFCALAQRLRVFMVTMCFIQEFLS